MNGNFLNMYLAALLALATLAIFKRIMEKKTVSVAVEASAPETSGNATLDWLNANM